MIINWVDIWPPDLDEERIYTRYIVGAAIEERFPDYTPFPEGTSVEDRRYKHGVDPNESEPCHAELHVYPPEENRVDDLSIHFLFPPGHPEHEAGVGAIPDLIKAVDEIKGLSLEEARDRVFGRVINPSSVAPRG